MIHQPPPVVELLAQLAAFGVNLAGELTGPVNWVDRPVSGEWSLGETICHLRDVELEVHQPRFRSVIAGPNAFIAGANPDEWAEQRRYRSEDGPAALAAFIAARVQTVALLTDLDSTLWQRHAQHAFLGQTTLHELLYLVISHDEAHRPQLEALVDPLN